MAKVSKDGQGKTLYIEMSIYPCGDADPTKNLTISCPELDTRFKTTLSDEGLKKFRDNILYFYSKQILKKGPHVSLYYGTARKNLKEFIPLTKEWLDRDGSLKEISEKWFEVKGIRFSRMTTAYEMDGMDYEELDKDKRSNVPILVSIDDLKLKKPVQMVWRHMGDPSRKRFEGNPNPNWISDSGAKEMLRDAKAANPDQKDFIEQIYEKYFANQPLV